MSDMAGNINHQPWLPDAWRMARNMAMRKPQNGWYMDAHAQNMIPSGKRLPNELEDPPCSMGKSTISMVIFNSTLSKLLVITRGYIPIISHYINHYKNPIKSPCFMVFDPSPISLKRRMWVDFLHISTSHALVHWGSFGHASFFLLKIR